MKDLQGTFATKVSIGPHDTKSIFNSQEHKSILRNSVSVRIQIRNRLTYLTAVSVRDLTQSRATLSTDADSKRLRECAPLSSKQGETLNVQYATVLAFQPNFLLGASVIVPSLSRSKVPM